MTRGGASPILRRMRRRKEGETHDHWISSRFDGRAGQLVQGGHAGSVSWPNDACPEANSSADRAQTRIVRFESRVMAITVNCAAHVDDVHATVLASSRRCRHRYFKGIQRMRETIFVRGLNFVALSAILTACGGSDPQPSERLARSVENLQCEAPRFTIRQLDAELAAAGLEVRSTSCASDGLGRVAACGTPSPYIRIIEVPRDQVERAGALGYLPLSTFPRILPIDCPAQ